MRGRTSLGVMAVLAGTFLLPACKKKVETSALAEADSLEEKVPETFFGACTEKAEMKGGNHYKVFDCGTQRASYYDSPGKMTFDEVLAPIASDARSNGYQVFPSDGTMTILVSVPAEGPATGEPSTTTPPAAPTTPVPPTPTPLPVKFLVQKTPPALGGETKYTTVVTLQPLEGERTRVHDCRIPATTDEAQYQASVAWCNAAFNEMFSYEKSAEEAILEMKQAELDAIEEAEKPVEDGKPTSVKILDE